MIHTQNNKILSAEKIYNFLTLVDSDFPIALSAKTDLKEYAEKLYSSATLCTVEDNDHIVSMAAGYTENTINNIAYLSMVASSPECRGKGYAKQLVSEFIDYAKASHLDAVHLYAVRENTPAMNMYKSLGFSEWHIENETRPKDVHFILRFSEI